MKGKNKGYLITAIVLVIVLIAIAFFYYSSGYRQYGARNNPLNGSKFQQRDMTGEKFADSPFYKSAYLISSDSLSLDAQKGISGFSLIRTQNSDGSTNITLKAINSEYSDQNFVVQSGQQLYFIENSWGDDSPPNGESNLRDDHAVLVDSNGNILSFG